MNTIFDVAARVSLLLLSRFSQVRLCATPEMTAHQAPPSLGFSRQEHWSGLPFPSPMRENEVAQSGRTPSDPMDCSLPGSTIPGTLQAITLECVAISLSNAWKWSRSVRSYPQQPHGLQPSRLLCPWDFPGRSTGVGCHWLFNGLLGK